MVLVTHTHTQTYIYIYIYFYPSEAILQRVRQEVISVIPGWITSYPPCDTFIEVVVRTCTFNTKEVVKTCTLTNFIIGHDYSTCCNTYTHIHLNYDQSTGIGAT